jgi:hypothetical protein
MLLSLPASAQYYRSSWPRHHVYGALGATLPQGDLAPLYNSAFGGSFGYSYRFHRNFQADLGMDIGYNSANVNDYLNTDIGAMRIRAFQYYIPVGASTVLPLHQGKVEIRAGGGYSYLRYSESLKQVSDYYQYSCPVCSSRDGQGYYGLVGFNYALDRAQMFRVGVFTRIVQGHTDGASVGLASARTRDRWINTFATLSMSF